MYSTNDETGFYDKIEQIAYEMQRLSVLAVNQYEPIVDMILEEHITSENEIAHIMDRMLDFCQFDNMLQLLKRLCRGIYYKYPSSVTEYIIFYKDMWESDEDSEDEE